METKINDTEMVEEVKNIEKEIENKVEKLSMEEIENLTEETIDEIFDDKDFSQYVEEIMKDSDHNSLQFKIDYLKFIKAHQEQNKVFDEFKLNVSNEMDKFKVQMDKLVSQFDSSESLKKIEEAIEITESEEEKERLRTVHDAVLFSLNLELIKRKIKNKGKDVIKKECFKNFEKTKKKAMKILKHDSKLYMNPNFMDNLYVIAEKSEYERIKTILYIVYRFVCEDKKVPLETSLFISYFILNCAKINSTEEISTMSIDRVKFMASIDELLEILK